MSNFPVYVQQGRYDCGPTCLRMIAVYYGRLYAWTKPEPAEHGTSLADLMAVATEWGFAVRGVRFTACTSSESLRTRVALPAIAHWQNEDGKAHWVVMVEIREGFVYIADPAWPFDGMRGFRLQGLSNYWDGILLLIHP